MSQREPDLCKVIPGEVVHGVTDDMDHIDRADLVDQQVRQPTSHFELGTMH